MHGEGFEFPYDLRVLDESDSIMRHFDAGTLNKEDLKIWLFFIQNKKQSKKIGLMDGDVRQLLLRLASSHGSMLYLSNNSNEANKTMNIISGRAKLEAGLFEGHRRVQED